jgi:tight adherence protein B
MMAMVAASFVLTLSLILGSYWVFVVRPERQSHDAVWKRLKLPGSSSRVRAQLLKRAQQLSTVPAFDTFLSRGQVALRPVELLIEQSGTRLTVGSFLMISGLCGVVPMFVFQQALGIPAISLAVGALSALAPTSVLRLKRTRRLLKFEEQFPEALDLLSRALKAGHAFTTGLGMIAEEMPAPIGPEFQLLHDQQNFGMPLPDALKEFARRVPLLDARFFVTAVLIQREAGGNLSEILDNIATVIRDRFRVKRQIRVISAHGRLTGGVLVAVPPTLGAVLFVINPDHWGTLIGNPLGLQLIGLAIFLQVTGTLIIRKLIRIEY